MHLAGTKAAEVANGLSSLWCKALPKKEVPLNPAALDGLQKEGPAAGTNLKKSAAVKVSAARPRIAQPAVAASRPAQVVRTFTSTA